MSSPADNEIVSVLAAIESITPEPPVLPIEGSRLARRRRPVTVAASAFFAVLAAVGISALITGRAPTSTFGSGAAADSITLGALIVPVQGEPVKSRGAWIYTARVADLGALDLADLGTQVALVPHPPGTFIVPTSGNPLEANALRAHKIVYLGDIAGAQVALHELEGKACIFLGNNTDITGGGRCLDGLDLVGGTSADPPVGRWLLWTGLPQSAAVVTAEGSDGTPYWEQVVGGTAFFVLPDGGSMDPSSLRALDGSGSEVSSTAGTSIRPFDLGICSPEDGC